MRRLLSKEEFVWKEKKTNNIESNPLQYWYTTYEDGEHSRLYYIIPQYPSKDGCCIDMSKDPELYIYFETIGYKLKEGEKSSDYSIIGNDYYYREGGFKRAFKTIEEAKDRAYFDYTAIFGYAMSFIQDNTENI